VVERLDDETLRQDPVLAALDPDLDSVLNVNTPADYQAARARPAPDVIVRLASGGARSVRAATAGAAAGAVGLVLGRSVTVTLNDDQITADRETPLVAGDTICFRPADAGPGPASGAAS
jgi:molybdenum cofactor guanylyltransferase